MCFLITKFEIASFIKAIDNKNIDEIKIILKEYIIIFKFYKNVLTSERLQYIGRVAFPQIAFRQVA